ncbi:enoyl-CoA hydratase [Oceanobacillus sp. FSL H7-0719]|uniref:enoyl-CoA hydratase n=1 Tax=Oceanobacillus sp. FSL H7-0719 TaxID=2954507 RepID=UPI00324EE8A0
MIDIKIKNNIAIVTLNRPDAANALSIEMLNEFNKALQIIDNDLNVYCTIITGAGDKAFCAGADLKERKNMSEGEVIQTVRYIGETMNNIERLRMPVIAAINGAAFGGGLELALACDIRIAADEIKLGLTETSLAIIPGAGGTQRLPRLIGLGQAKRLIYTAKPVRAEEALKLGIVEEVTEKGQLIVTAMKLAEAIASNGPIALEQAKTAINRGMQTDISTGLEIEHLSYKQTIPTKDRQEGLLAFKEKRKPRYKGE